MAEAGRGANIPGCRLCIDCEGRDVAPISADNGLGRGPTPFLVPSRSAPKTPFPKSSLPQCFLSPVETGDDPAPAPVTALVLRAPTSLAFDSVPSRWEISAASKSLATATQLPLQKCHESRCSSNFRSGKGKFGGKSYQGTSHKSQAVCTVTHLDSSDSAAKIR